MTKGGTVPPDFVTGLLQAMWLPNLRLPLRMSFQLGLYILPFVSHGAIESTKICETNLKALMETVKIYIFIGKI